jgi:hypothetical protein
MEIKMSIHKKYNETIVLCDSCQEEVAVGIDFETAIYNFKMNGGKFDKQGDQWFHYCSQLCKDNERR